MLQREAEKAFAERQRRARIMGNEAGTKLLMPMMLMLLVVLIVVLYPAMVSFYA
jgi:tight adherence protein C